MTAKKSIDFIGDVHGQAGVLKQLLRQLGYRTKNGAYIHPTNHAVFLGDILNRGPEIREAVDIVRKMVEKGSATLLLGNHEFLALWQSRHPRDPVKGCPLSERARRHLEATHRSYAKANGAWKNLLEWLSSQPIYFLHPHVRGVHACWSTEAILQIRNNRLRRDDLQEVHSERFRALWLLLEGPSLVAPNGTSFRIRWWSTGSQTWRQLAYPPKKAVPCTKIPQSRLRKTYPYPSSEPPLFFGHYGFPKPLGPILPNLACLDLAVAQGGPIASYRWTGEKRLLPKKFSSCPPKPPPRIPGKKLS